MPEHADFVHLRVYTAFSLTEGAIKIPDLVAACVRERMPAVAITDTGNLFGALEFAMAAASAGVQPIIGCQLAISMARDAGGMTGKGPEPDQLVVLVQNEAGYRNLMSLVSKSFLEGEPGQDPQLGLSDFEGKSDGLMALTGGHGILIYIVLAIIMPESGSVSAKANGFDEGEIVIKDAA